VKNLIDGLLNPNVYDHPVKYFEVIETHISHVILTGEYAYKIKKPIKYDFLDYSTLDSRRTYCEKELAFNTRLATEVYLEVVTINQLPNGKLKINGEGPIVEYALKMREFQQSQLFDSLVNNGRLNEDHFDMIAERIARFYQHIESAAMETPYGTPEDILRKADDNFEQAKPFLISPEDLAQLEKLQTLTANVGRQLMPIFEKRKEEGFIKACHGDLHLSNIALLKDTPVIFDCIEFNEFYRWTDTMADVGFLMMDLYYRGYPHFANHFLNSYLTYYGDYEGLKILPFYIAYRAMVRGKIQLFETTNEHSRPAEELFANYRRYAGVAEHFLGREKPMLVIMHGVSGSGKTRIAHELSPLLHAVHIRADIERKRLFGLQPTDRVTGDQASELYSVESNERTYNQLALNARQAIDAGFSVIIDATFKFKAQREKFRQLAQDLNIPFVVLHCTISKANAEAAIQSRLLENKDASDATVEVLSKQMEVLEALSGTEANNVVEVCNDETPEVTAVFDLINQVVNNQCKV
jgi:aminoglycoside phosphotransferase family enzyme/predicted kinase